MNKKFKKLWTCMAAGLLLLLLPTHSTPLIVRVKRLCWQGHVFTSLGKMSLPPLMDKTHRAQPNTEAYAAQRTTHKQQQPSKSHNAVKDPHMPHLWPAAQHRPSTPHYKLRPPLSQNCTRTHSHASSHSATASRLRAAATRIRTPLLPTDTSCLAHP